MLKNLKVKTMKTFWGQSIPLVILCSALLVMILFCSVFSPYADAMETHDVDCVCELCELMPHSADCVCETCITDGYCCSGVEILFVILIIISFFAVFYFLISAFEQVYEYYRMYQFLEDIERYNAHYPQLVQLTPERYKDLKLLYKETRDHVHELYILSVANKKNN